MNKIKVIAVLFFILPAGLAALVFERPDSGVILEPGIIAVSVNSLKFRINGKDAELESFESETGVKKILEACLANAERRGYRVINNVYVWFAANTLYRVSGNDPDAGSFGYIFTMDKKNRAVFLVAGDSGGVSHIVRAKVHDFTGTPGGHDDGLQHYTGARRMLSVEFLSGEKTLNFGNFYIVENAGRKEVCDYYAGEFKRAGWEFSRIGNGNSGDFYELEGKSGKVTFSVSDGTAGGDVLIFIMG